MGGQVSDILDIYYPKWRYCLKKGHHGKRLISIEPMLDDDRSYDMRVERCSHCKMALKEDYASEEDLEKYMEEKNG